MRRGVLVYLCATFLLPLAAACLNKTYDRAFDGYIDCVRACLACPDVDYSNDFANNCNYAAGDCCRSRFHTVIASSWGCAKTQCGDSLAQKAFLDFVQHCADVSVPLAVEDVPPGFSLANSSQPGVPPNSSQPGVSWAFLGVFSLLCHADRGSDMVRLVIG